MATDPFCKCGHRKSDHDDSVRDWGECYECECDQYRRARGEEAVQLNERGSQGGSHTK